MQRVNRSTPRLHPVAYEEPVVESHAMRNEVVYGGNEDRSEWPTVGRRMYDIYWPSSTRHGTTGKVDKALTIMAEWRVRSAFSIR